MDWTAASDKLVGWLARGVWVGFGWVLLLLLLTMMMGSGWDWRIGCGFGCSRDGIGWDRVVKDFSLLQFGRSMRKVDGGRSVGSFTCLLASHWVDKGSAAARWEREGS